MKLVGGETPLTITSNTTIEEKSKALRRYWADYGFLEADGDYLVLGEMADTFDD